MSTTKREGFWKSSSEPNLPMPEAHLEPTQSQVGFLRDLDQIEKKAEATAYRGWSTCRICKSHNGDETFRYKGWEWPSGYRHYIVVHNVWPSREFYKFIAGEVDGKED